MNTIYIILLIILSLILNVSVTLAMPYVKQYWNAFITQIKRKFTRTKPAIDATAYLEILSRLDDIEKRLDKRQINYRQAMRQEIENVLLKLKNGD